MSRITIALAAAVAATAVSIPVASLAGGSSHRSGAVLSVCVTVTPKQVSVSVGPETATQGASLSRTCEVI